MSRCFSYPPPGYYRDVAKHDALIESIKLQKDTIKSKADRKKEKKAKKEKKEKKHKESKNTEVKSHKIKIDDFYKGTKTVNELYEKSDLTQEHGKPIRPQQPSYSSDSTENSSKRKRDDYSLLPPDNSSGHGSFKIRFLKKQKASDSNSVVADVISIPSSSNSNRNLVSSIGNDGCPSTSWGENRNFTKIADLHGLQYGKIQPVSYVSRDIDHSVLSNLVSNKTSTLSVEKKPVNDVSVGPKKQTEDSKKVRLSRAEKKMIKKHVKYEKLIGSWLPPVLQAEVGDDEDWLSKGKTVKPSMCRGEVETCRESVAPWQPCARFLAEVDIHALPYTVPF